LRHGLFGHGLCSRHRHVDGHDRFNDNNSVRQHGLGYNDRHRHVDGHDRFNNNSVRQHGLRYSWYVNGYDGFDHTRHQRPGRRHVHRYYGLDDYRDDRYGHDLVRYGR
jgi:hypothetical protein